MSFIGAGAGNEARACNTMSTRKLPNYEPQVLLLGDTTIQPTAIKY